MTEFLTKRHLTEELDDDSYEADVKRQELNKKNSKPGRKPIDTEPKNKRTAQNRAAQRAFRERKERKMKDLEDKISSLEDEKKSANTEAEFLRLQVQMLMGELSKHRDTSDISDLKLPPIPKNSSISSSRDTPSSDVSSTFSPADSDTTSKSTSNLEQDFNNKTPQFSFEFPWSRKSSINQKSPSTANSTSSNNIPGLASDASTASSAESSPFELYNTEEQRDLPLFNQIKKKSLNSTTPVQEFQFDDHFDEGISEFCQDLNSACGTKDCPVPKSKSQASTPANTAPTPLPLTAGRLNSIQEDPLSFLNDGNLEAQFGTFDPSLAFVDGSNDFNDLFDETDKPEADPIASLTTEESLYDPFGLFNNSKQSPIVESNPQSKSSLSSSGATTNQSIKQGKSPLVELGLTSDTANDDEEIVPAKEGRLLKCTEIWDRITAHPKYSDIDIDGLCSELRAKAKCSDRGVVIDFADVNNVILNSLPKKKN